MYTTFQQLRKLTQLCITIGQDSLEVNTGTELVLTRLVPLHMDRFHQNDHNPCILALKGTEFEIKKFSGSAI